MSLISKDFRLNQQQPHENKLFRLRWALLAIAGAGIGVVIASTNTETKHSKEFASDSLPAFQTVTKSSDDLARERFSLGLPELQAQMASSQRQVQLLGRGDGAGGFALGGVAGHGFAHDFHTSTPCRRATSACWGRRGSRARVALAREMRHPTSG